MKCFTPANESARGSPVPFAEAILSLALPRRGGSVSGESDSSSSGYEDEDSSTTPRSPIMHIVRGRKKIK